MYFSAAASYENGHGSNELCLEHSIAVFHSPIQSRTHPAQRRLMDSFMSVISCPVLASYQRRFGSSSAPRRLGSIEGGNVKSRIESVTCQHRLCLSIESAFV
jgi:hypothetical protein